MGKTEQEQKKIEGSSQWDCNRRKMNGEKNLFDIAHADK